MSMANLIKRFLVAIIAAVILISGTVPVFAATKLKTPELSGKLDVYGIVNLSWNRIPGADGYKVYSKITPTAEDGVAR